MLHPELPADEKARLQELRAYGVLDTDPEPGFDELTQVAARVCDAPIALVSLIDEDRQWFKSRVGLEAPETPRDVAFCAHAILEPQQILLVPDSSKDPRFRGNPLVEGPPHVGAYAGAPLRTSSGKALGTLCVIDHRPREWGSDQVEILGFLANQVVSQLELRRTTASLAEQAVRLDHSRQELQELVSLAAHELQEPLRVSVAFSELLGHALGDRLTPPLAEYLDRIVLASRRIRHMVTDFLTLSTTGSKGLTRGSVDLADCLHAGLKPHRRTMDESSAQVILPADYPEAQGDERLLALVFEHLIGNALKFSGDEAPEIRVALDPESDRLVVKVEDNGLGMAEAYLERIWRPFKRLHGRNEAEGTGIGLAMVRKIVELHGGETWVTSEPGKGSCFAFSLPTP